MELYKEGKITSPSFSIIITSSNINRLYLGDIMKNDYIKNYVNNSMNKGECEIIDNKWQCRTEYIIYTDFEYSGSGGKSSTKSLVKFNLKENKLTIPYHYYNFLVVGYRYEPKRKGGVQKKYNKWCSQFNDKIYCTCSAGKNSFGIISLFFKNDSRLDVDLRDYVDYDSSAYFFKCRIDVSLSDEEEFIVGLRGLNNTILSFDLDDKKIEFFIEKRLIFLLVY